MVTYLPLNPKLVSFRVRNYDGKTGKYNSLKDN